jgi:prepilin peptidase CpaA
VGALAADESLITTAAFTLVMVLAAVLDLTSRRIPNALTVTAVVAGLVLRVPLGLDALFDGLVGTGLALGVTIPLFLVGALGGGDVKLLGAVGAFMGPERLAGAGLLIGLVGGVIALMDAIRRGTLRRVLMNTLHLVIGWISPGRSDLPTTLTSPSAMTIPYGVPIALGALVWWFWGGTSL